MKNTRMLRAALFVSALALTAAAGAAEDGKALYAANCFACHGTGAAGAPILGDAAAWAPRIKTGAQALFTSATKGKGVMPPRGGNPKLTDAEIKAVVGFMIAQSSGAAKPAAAATPATPAVAAKPAAPAPVAAAPAAAAPVATAPAAVAPAAATTPVAAAPGANVNTFNRLMRPAAKRNLPPAEDGIHDPANEGTLSLQPPLAAFDTLPKGNYGNRIDWVAALNNKAINPRFDRNDPSVQAMVMDLNIVREVKGSMPDVVYPHKQHTEWLDCSNCHPAIFIPQKGANQISMAAILLGQKCGVCHGKVAFPISDCRRCHSKSKTLAVSAPATQ
jgi:c(7)-type cytochrome triheme protein